MVEDEASSWRGRACSPAVVRVQNGRKGIRSAASASDLQKSPYNSPHHAMHKSVRCNLKPPVASSRAGGPAGGLNAADAVGGLRARPAERRKLVCAEKVRRSRIHEVDVWERRQRNAPVPVQSTWSVRDVVVVGPACGVEASMEVLWCWLGVQDGDLRRQKAAKLGAQSVRVGRRLGHHVCHLPSGVDPCVCSPGSHHVDGLAKGCCESGLQLALNRPLSRLDLPAVEVGSIVLDQKAGGGHRRCSEVGTSSVSADG